MDYPVHESTSFEFDNFLTHPCDLFSNKCAKRCRNHWANPPKQQWLVYDCQFLFSLKEINTLKSHIQITGEGRSANLMFKIIDPVDRTIQASTHTGTFIDQYMYRQVYLQTSTCTDQYMYGPVHLETSTSTDQYIYRLVNLRPNFF